MDLDQTRSRTEGGAAANIAHPRQELRIELDLGGIDAVRGQDTALRRQHVGRRIAQFASPSISSNDSAFDNIRPPQHGGRVRDGPRLQKISNPRGADRHAVHHDRRNGAYRKAKPRRGFEKSLDRSATSLTKAKVLTDVEFLGPQFLAQHIPHKFFRCLSGELRSERQSDDHIDAGFLEQYQLLRGIAEKLELNIRRQYPKRVGVKGQHNDRPVQVLRSLLDKLQNGPVSQMQAVEIPDGDNGERQPGSVLEALEHLHRDTTCAASLAK